LPNHLTHGDLRASGMSLSPLIFGLALVILIGSLFQLRFRQSAGYEKFASWRTYATSVESDRNLVVYFTLATGSGQVLVNRGAAATASADVPAQPGMLRGVPVWAIGQGRWPGYKDALYFPTPSDFLDVPVTDAIRNMGNDWTLQVWIKPTFPQQGSVFFPLLKGTIAIPGPAGPGTVSDWPLVSMRLDAGDTAHVMASAPAIESPSVLSFRSAPIEMPSSWNQVTVVRSGLMFRTFVNGEEVRGLEPRPDVPTSSIFPHLTTLQLGGGFASAFIDELAIYNRAMSPEQIRASYENGQAP